MVDDALLEENTSNEKNVDKDEQVFSVLIVGDPGVGKTSFIRKPPMAINSTLTDKREKSK